MRTRPFILAIVLCLLASPLLCFAGVTSHPCECGDNVCCSTSESEDENCDVDPCGQMATVRVESHPDDAGTTAYDVVAGVAATPPRAVAYVDRLPFSRNLRLPTASITSPIRS